MNTSPIPPFAVDVGEEGRIRTVCSGLVGHVLLEEMQVRIRHHVIGVYAGMVYLGTAWRVPV